MYRNMLLCYDTRKGEEEEGGRGGRREGGREEEEEEVASLVAVGQTTHTRHDTEHIVVDRVDLDVTTSVGARCR